MERDFSPEELNADVSWENCLDQILQNDPDYKLEHWMEIQEIQEEMFGERHKIRSGILREVN